MVSWQASGCQSRISGVMELYQTGGMINQMPQSTKALLPDRSRSDKLIDHYPLLPFRLQTCMQEN